MQINNGNRYVIDTDGIPNELGRDSDKLLYKYRNLRWSLYHKYSGYLSTPVEREELQEYIDEQFIKLVKEYDIHSNVDFPGYIKTKLTLRVQNSYIKKADKYRKTEALGKRDNTVEVLTDIMGEYPSDIEESELVRFIFTNSKLTPTQECLLKELLTNPDREDDKYIVSHVAGLMEVRREEVAQELTELRDYVRFKVEAFYSQTIKVGLVGTKKYTENNIWQ